MDKVQSNEALKNHCMVVHAYYPLGETRVERQARALVDYGYQVDVICLRSPTESPFETIDGVHVYRLPVQRHKKSGPAVQLLEYLAFFVLVFFKLAALHRQRQYQVVQIHNLPDFLVFAALIPKLTGARLLLDLHDLMPEFYAARFNTNLSAWPVRLVRWQEYLACAFAHHVITVTELWRQTLIQRGVPASKTSVVMNVADSRVFYPQVNLKPASTPDSPFKLIYHGNLTQRYGLDLIIRAVEIATRQIPHLHLIIHGSGEYQDTLVNLVNNLNLTGHVTFSTQFIPTDELSQFIHQATVGLVPYRRDVFTDRILPTKLMEYAALGMPVIAARTPAIEAYFDSSMVEFFTPDDENDLARCILLLYNNREQLTALSQGIKKFNQHYNWRKLSMDYVNLVEHLRTSIRG